MEERQEERMKMAIEVAKQISCHGVNVLQRYIDNGFDVNSVDGDGWNLLHSCLVSVTEKCPASTVQKLIVLGVSVNAPDNDGWTPLHFAVRQQNIDAVKLIAEVCRNIDVQTHEGETPLRLAIKKPRSIPLIRVLLDYGANPDKECSGGKTVRDIAKSLVDGHEVVEVFDRYN